MNLPELLHDRLAKEYRFAADKMQESAEPDRKLYYLSAFYGEASRILNWTWDRDLVLIHSVLQHTYQQVIGRVQAGSRAVGLSASVFEGLTEAADALATYVENHGQEQNLQVILGRFAELAYASTGNGSYLLERGTLRL